MSSFSRPLYLIGIEYPNQWYHIFAILPEDLSTPEGIVKTGINLDASNDSLVVNNEETNELISQFFIVTPEEVNQPREAIESEDNTEIPDKVNSLEPGKNKETYSASPEPGKAIIFNT